MESPDTRPAKTSTHNPDLTGPKQMDSIDNSLSSQKKVNFQSFEDPKQIEDKNYASDSKPQNTESTISSPKQKNRKSVFGAPSKIRSLLEFDSSPSEFRNGLRVQKKAYERRNDEMASSLAFGFSSRRLSNAYVERLKQFYQYESVVDSYAFPPLWSARESITKNSKNEETAMASGKLPSFVKGMDKDSRQNVSKDFLVKPDSPKSGDANKERTVTPAKIPYTGVTITVTSPSGKTVAADDSVLDKEISIKSKQSKHKHQIHKKNNQNKKHHNDTKPTPENSGKRICKDESHTHPENTSSKSRKIVNQPNKSSKTSQQSQSIETMYFPNQSNLSPRIPPPVPMIVIPHTTSHTSPKHFAKQDSNVSKSDSLTSSSSATSSSPVDTQSILEAVQRLGLSRRSSNAAGLGVSKHRQQQRIKRRLNRAAVEKDSENVAMKLSIPCQAGCCYCVYASLLGPVKIYLSRGDKPKKEPCVLGIKDGNGRPGIPVSRKEDITGLIYDAHNYSFHPPQHPLPSHRRSLNPVESKSGSGVGSRMTNKTPSPSKQKIRGSR